MKMTLMPIGVLACALAICAAPSGAQEDERAQLTIAPAQLGLPEAPGVAAELLPDGSAVSVTAAELPQAVTLDLGWMPVEPSGAYRARYRVRPVGLQEPASVYLMLREHPGEGARPFQPYQRESVTVREVQPDPDGEWIERTLSFVTRPETQFLSGAIVVLALNGELQFGAFELSVMAPPAPPVDPAQAWAEYEQMMAEIRAQADSRVPLTPRPLVFSRSQMKYGLQRNYYHQWNDRPLLVSRAYREDSPYVTPPGSYQRTLQQVVKYGIDGLAFFPETKGRLEMFDLHEQLGIDGVGLLPEFLTAYTEDHVQLKGDILERALRSPFAPRIDGKLLITSYGAASYTPAQWQEILDALRARVGDSFVFLPSLTNVVGLRGPLMEGNPIPRAEVEAAKAYLREYLDVCDGIYFNYPPALRKKDHSFDAEFYREVFIPVFKSVLAEPAYRDKYLGLSAYRAHMASDRGNNLHEDYTRTLRSSFEAAMEARPDVIILPEWDEQNENTSFRPTVYGGTTSGRLLRYYMSRIKAEPPTPWPGDDTSIPNLILSTRKVITLGEPVIVELVNVPDGTTGTYQVELALQDEAGRVVRSFPPVSFDSAALQEERLSLPSETLPDVRALVPVLTVRGYQGRDLSFDSGFHHIQVRATWNWDYLCVRQPLRDLLPEARVELAWRPGAGADGSLTLTGTVSAPQELGLVELLGDDDEVYAVDANGEFLRDDPDVERFVVEYRALNTVPLQGALTLRGATSPVWLCQGAPVAPVAVEGPAPGQRIELLTEASEAIRWIYFAVPRDRLTEATLDWDFDAGSFSVPLREVLAKQIVARDFEGTVHVSVQPYRRQIDLPCHLTEREVSFEVPIWPEIATEQYHLRITTADGKLFRSRPLLLPDAEDTARVPLRIYSETEQRGVDVPVAPARIPVLDYEFDPERGAVLLSGDDRPFWAVLGGYSNTTTGRGSPNGLWRSTRGQYPASATRSAPAWVEEDGRPCLEFDGAGTYLELPRESLPRRGAWTLSFEVKPADDRDQYLLVSRIGASQRGLGLAIVDGKLVARYHDSDWGTSNSATGLAVPAGQWSTITVRHDFEQMTLSVNGETATCPVTRPAYNIGFTLIGEGWTSNWFAGRLRGLHITHNAP